MNDELLQTAPVTESARLPVLVIEDDAALLERVCTILESHGYPVIGRSWDEDVQRQLLDWKIAGIVVGTARLKTMATDFRRLLSHSRPDLEKRAVFLSPQVSPKQLLSVADKSFGKPPKTERILVVDDEEPVRGELGLVGRDDGSGESFQQLCAEPVDQACSGISTASTVS